MIDMDERLFDPEKAICDLTLDEINRLEAEFAAAKVDEWCTSSVLFHAANALRRAAGLPTAAPAVYALDVADDKARTGDLRAARAVKAFLGAAADYEGARVALAELRRHHRPAA